MCPQGESNTRFSTNSYLPSIFGWRSTGTWNAQVGTWITCTGPWMYPIESNLVALWVTITSVPWAVLGDSSDLR